MDSSVVDPEIERLQREVSLLDEWLNGPIGSEMAQHLREDEKTLTGYVLSDPMETVESLLCVKTLANKLSGLRCFYDGMVESLEEKKKQLAKLKS